MVICPCLNKLVSSQVLGFAGSRCSEWASRRPSGRIGRRRAVVMWAKWQDVVVVVVAVVVRGGRRNQSRNCRRGEKKKLGANQKATRSGGREWATTEQAAVKCLPAGFACRRRRRWWWLLLGVCRLQRKAWAKQQRWGGRPGDLRDWGVRLRKKGYNKIIGNGVCFRKE